MYLSLYPGFNKQTKKCNVYYHHQHSQTMYMTYEKQSSKGFCVLLFRQSARESVGHLGTGVAISPTPRDNNLTSAGKQVYGLTHGEETQHSSKYSYICQGSSLVLVLVVNTVWSPCWSLAVRQSINIRFQPCSIQSWKSTPLFWQGWIKYILARQVLYFVKYETWFWWQKPFFFSNKSNLQRKYIKCLFSEVVLTKHSTEKSSSHTGCSENVRMCTQYGAQGHVKIKIPSSLLWIIFWVGPDTWWSDLCALLGHFHTVLLIGTVDIFWIF